MINNIIHQNKKLMKKAFFAVLCAVAGLASCTKESDEQVKCGFYVETDCDTLVTISFNPTHYFVTPMDARTRATISEAATQIDLWLSDGETMTDVHQSSSDPNFGTVTVTLDKRNTYTLYALAHKGSAAATLTEGTVSFPDDKIKDTFWYTTTFSPATTSNVNCDFERIVAQVRIETTDPIPSNVKKMRITVNDVYDRWSLTDGPDHQLNRVSTITISSTSQDGTATFNFYAITTDTETLHTVTCEALDSEDAVVQMRSFTEIPRRSGYKTCLRGDFFVDQPMSLTFSVADWSEYDTINF